MTLREIQLAAVESELRKLHPDATVSFMVNREDKPKWVVIIKAEFAGKKFRGMALAEWLPEIPMMLSLITERAK